MTASEYASRRVESFGPLSGCTFTRSMVRASIVCRTTQTGDPRPSATVAMVGSRFPRHAIRAGAGLDLLRHRPGSGVDDRDEVIAVHRDVRDTSGWRNQNPLGSTAEREAFDLAARRGIEDDEVAGVEIGNQREPAVA